MHSVEIRHLYIEMDRSRVCASVPWYYIRPDPRATKALAAASAHQQRPVHCRFADICHTITFCASRAPNETAYLAARHGVPFSVLYPRLNNYISLSMCLRHRRGIHASDTHGRNYTTWDSSFGKPELVVTVHHFSCFIQDTIYFLLDTRKVNQCRPTPMLVTCLHILKPF